MTKIVFPCAKDIIISPRNGIILKTFVTLKDMVLYIFIPIKSMFFRALVLKKSKGLGMLPDDMSISFY